MDITAQRYTLFYANFQDIRITLWPRQWAPFNVSA